jgi:hypothetical protein
MGYLASGLVLTAFCLKAMTPLRIVALCSNIAFMAYGLSRGLPPVWLLHSVLLPVNAWRLWQLIGDGCFGSAVDNNRGRAGHRPSRENGWPGSRVITAISLSRPRRAEQISSDRAVA